ncbi:MAG: DUF3343 domain-containing protein [Oscillospiraceae bacterium]|nr:DUF3343 domain-containing protein [Oscillospiraceae bacterium]
MSVNRELRAVITFSTTTYALEAESLCRKERLPGRLIPVPSAISAGCGMAWSTAPESAGAVMKLLKKEKVPFEGITELLL